MKKIYLLSKACLFTAAMFMFSACAEDEAVVTPVFPEGETVETVTPGTEYTLTFSANMNWELESSKPWCKFSNGFQSVKGEAGENISQKIVVTTDGMTLQDDIAEITLIMGDEEKVIAKYTRGGLVPSVTDFNNNVYGEENPLAFEYTNNGVELIKGFIANFSWRLTDSDLPEWIKINEGSEIGGNAGDKVQISFYVPEEFWLTAQEGNIKIKNDEIGCEVIIPVTFAGMPEGIVDVKGLSSVWNWVISQDGTQYWQNSQGNMEEEIQKYDLPVTLKVLVKNNDYVVKCLYNDGDWMTPESYYKFFNIEDDNQGNVTIGGFSQLDGAKRKGYVIIMPTVKYNELTNNGQWGDNVLVDGKDVSSEVLNYVVMSLEQEGTVQEGVEPIKIFINGSEEGVKAINGTGNVPETVLSYIEEQYMMVENKEEYIFNYTVQSTDNLKIFPYLKDITNHYSTMNNCTISDFENPYEPIINPTIVNNEEKPEESYVEFVANQDLQNTKSLVLTFKDNSGMPAKFLILHVNE